MKSHFKNYFQSFNFNKKFWKTFILDVATFFLITIVWMSLGKILSAKAYVISGGKSVDELKALMLSGSLDANQALLGSIKSFVYIFYIGVILTIIITLLLFALSRMMLWEKIINKKFSWKRFSKWNGLIIILMFLSAIYLLFFVLVRLLFNVLTSAVGNTFYLIVSTILNYLFFIILIFFIFIIFFSYTEINTVWASIGHAFHLIKANWSKLWRMFIFVIITGLIIGFIASFLPRLLFQYSEIIPMVLSLIIFFFFLAWMRLYLLKTMEHEHKH